MSSRRDSIIVNPYLLCELPGLEEKPEVLSRLLNVNWVKCQRFEESKAFQEEKKRLLQHHTGCAVFFSNWMQKKGLSWDQTLNISAKMSEGQLPSRAATEAEETREVIQHVEVFQQIIAHAYSEQELTVETLKTWNKTLMSGLNGFAGEYRTGVVLGGPHCFPPASVVTTLLDDLVLENKNKMQVTPLEHAAWLLFEFFELHPFVCGNGRMSRLLASWVLLRRGLPCVTSFTLSQERAKHKYEQIIQKVRATQSLKALTTCIADDLCCKINNLVENFERIQGTYNYHKRME